MSFRKYLLALRCSRGATIVEFALVAPVFLTLLIGVFDVSHTLYSSSILQGTMQQAGRDFTLENANGRQADLDAYVTKRVQQIAPNATVTFERKSYFDFSDVEQEEKFTDLNTNGVCDNGEPFEDANDNGQWDDDRGQDGIGGARDAMLYTATVTYPRLFQLASYIGLPENVSLSASTVLRNQPYDKQDRTVPTGNCDDA